MTEIWLQLWSSEDFMTDFKLPLVCLKRPGVLWMRVWRKTALGHVMGDVDPLTKPEGMPLLGIPEPWSSTQSAFPPPDLPPEDHVVLGPASPSPACQVFHHTEGQLLVTQALLRACPRPCNSPLVFLLLLCASPDLTVS